MSQKYLNDLIRIAKVDLPSLQYDFNNASTLYALQAACQRLFNITGYLLYQAIHEATEQKGTQPLAAQVAPTPAPAPVSVPLISEPVFQLPIAQHDSLPPPPFITQPVAAPSAMPDDSGVTIQPGITNVMITAQGTRIVAPSGAATVLPPGEAVDLATSLGRPILPPAEPGVEQVILPPGGGMTPDLLAALASRTGSAE